MKSDLIRQRESIRAIHEKYDYWNRVPHRGLFINGRPAITQIDPTKIGEYVVMTVRDPLAAYDRDPAEVIASMLEDSELVGKSGMFTTYTGQFKGARISVVSGGSGSPEAELALNDLMEFTDASAFVRVGSSGAISEKIKVGDCVISTGVHRDEATSAAYIDPGYPAYCHYELVTAFVQAAESLGIPYHLGVTVSVDSDFVGNGRPSVGGYLQPRNIEKLATFNRAGILNSDREASIIVTMCNLFERRGGAVFSVTDNIISGEKFVAGEGTDNSIRIVLEGFSVLKKLDDSKRAAGKQNWFPGIFQSR
ncbi:nucleoside phosphorylase [Nitrospirales bacterium NOB]|nr:nucleoside phosphorylase [Nitrospirales bacterium NOB]